MVPILPFFILLWYTTPNTISMITSNNRIVTKTATTALNDPMFMSLGAAGRGGPKRVVFPSGNV